MTRVPRFAPVALAAGSLFFASALSHAQTPADPAPAPRVFQPGVSPEVPPQLDLATAIAFALQNNFAIRQARERIREQEGLIMEVKAQVLPTVSASSSYYRLDKDLDEGGAPGALTRDRSWTIGIQVRQLLYSGGGVRAALDAQDYVRQASLFELQAVINQQLLAVRAKFYQVLLARDSIGVQEENVKLLREQLQTATNRFEAGAVSNFDVLRSEVAVANAQPALIRARNTYRTSIEELRQLLGYDAPDTGDSNRRTPVFLGELVFEPVNYELDQALSAAHTARPELQQLKELEGARDRGIRNAKSGYYPEVAVVGGYEANKSSFSNNFDDSIHGWTAGVTASWNIFDGRRTAGRVRQARSQYEQARLSTAETALAIEVEVRRSLSSLQEAQELAQAAQQVVKQAEEALRLAQARYSAGSATQLDVLETQVALTESRTNQLVANYNYNVAVASVRTAMGQADQFVVEAAP